MLFILITALITLLCVFALINTVKDRNILGVVISLASIGVFGWFTIMSFLKMIS